RTAYDQHAELADRERSHAECRTVGQGIGLDWLESWRVCLLSRRHRLQRHGILQARNHGDEELFPLAGGRTGRASARLRSAPETARYGMPEQLRTALDCRHRHRRQKNEGRWATRRRLLLLPWRSAR